jgi:META domain
MSDEYTGKWHVESITQDGQTTQVTANAWATFADTGRIRLFDTTNRIGGQYQVVKGGFAVREASTTLVGYFGDDPVRRHVMAAFKAMSNAGPVAASVADDQLTVRAGEFRIVFRRAM